MSNQALAQTITNERQEELHLLDRVLRGSTQARTRFFLRYTSVVEARVRQVLRRAGSWISEDDIQDMVSEIWLSLFEDDMRPLRRFDPERQIKVATWIGLLARNKTIDKLRTSHLGRTVSIDEKEGTREPASSRPLPTDEVERREQQSLAVQAMEQLSHEERRFMKAWYIEDREPEELASDFNIAIGTVYSRRFKIQAKLAKAIRRLSRPRRHVTRRTLH
jgi:RNA polymerase sigma-70 factor (ECF subfamily)